MFPVRARLVLREKLKTLRFAGGLPEIRAVYCIKPGKILTGPNRGPGDKNALKAKIAVPLPQSGHAALIRPIYRACPYTGCVELIPRYMRCMMNFHKLTGAVYSVTKDI
jgi:hypothetical protein